MVVPLPSLAFGAYMLFGPQQGYQRVRNNTASSLTWTVAESAPTGVSEATAFGVPRETSYPVFASLAAMGWVDLSRAVFGDSRNLRDWERAALDEFTWAELES